MHWHLAGQLSVAIGRVTSLDGLRVVNYKRHMGMKHPSHVATMYDKHISIGKDEDLSCCLLASIRCQEVSQFVLDEPTAVEDASTRDGNDDTRVRIQHQSKIMDPTAGVEGT